MPNPSTFQSLLGAIERYFDLMFEAIRSDVCAERPTARITRRKFAVVARTRLQECTCLRTIAGVKECPTPAGGFVRRDGPFPFMARLRHAARHRICLLPGEDRK
jgi:hypothetical protein